MGSGEACTPGTPPLDDKGQMIGTPGLRSMALDSWNGQGFLAWDPDAAMGRPRNMPGGTTNVMTLISDFSDMVDATGELGSRQDVTLTQARAVSFGVTAVSSMTTPSREVAHERVDPRDEHCRRPDVPTARRPVRRGQRRS